MRVAILGSGAWGAAFGLALAADKTTKVIFWDRNNNAAKAAAAGRPLAFPDLSVAVCAETAPDIATAVADVDLTVIAVSSGGFEQVLRQLSANPSPVVWLSKGFNDKGPYASRPPPFLGVNGRFAVISGPSFAEEVMRGMPTALTLAASRQADADKLQEQLHRPFLRLYKNDDIVGVCVAGALKNIIAIAAGVCDGMALGYNARAALVTRALVEMAAFNSAMGGKNETLGELCGIGDIFLSCTSDLSRNRRLGFNIGVSNGVVDITETCEGVTAVESILAHAREAGISMPISEMVGSLLRGDCLPQTALAQLLKRPIRK